MNLNIINKSTLNKKIKFDTLLKQGLELYTKNGLRNTSVDQITKKAGVGKGTFYLYFKNKDDFINQIVYKLNIDILQECMKKADKKGNLNAIDYTYYTKNPSILKLIHKNFSWSILVDKLNNTKQPQELFHVFENKYKEIQIENEQVNYTLFILIQLVGSVCYESIINRSPASIDKFQETLMTTIEKILTPLDVKIII